MKLLLAALPTSVVRQSCFPFRPVVLNLNFRFESEKGNQVVSCCFNIIHIYDQTDIIKTLD